MEKIRQTTLEIDLNALAHNYAFMRNKISTTTRLMGVVKASAYGSDSVRIGKKLIELGADFLGVAYVEEGIHLVKNGIELPVLVFHPHPIHFEDIIENGLRPSIFSKLSLEKFIETAERMEVENYPIHLKLNTGLNRLGFSPQDLDFVLSKLRETSAIKIEGIFSHLAASEDANEREFTLGQIASFKEMSTQIMDHLETKPLLHLCNSSGILNYPEAHFDMVRTGIALYGYGNDPKYDQQLRPVGRLKTTISQIHSIQKGDSVGYNRRFIAREEGRTATLAFGYADGMHRHYSNGRTSVYVNGKRARIIGDVCMDMIMIEVTEIDCQEGDEVLIFGKEHDAQNMADTAGTISYELITTISKRVKRVFIE